MKVFFALVSMFAVNAFADGLRSFDKDDSDEIEFQMNCDVKSIS